MSEVGNGDNVTVKCSDGVYRKFFLSSVRAPRPVNISREGEDSAPVDQRIRARPLYDVPFLFEAREQLRTFVGKSVRLTSHAFLHDQLLMSPVPCEFPPL